MKTAEFLNTKANYMLQVLPEHAGDDPESGLVKVPDGAESLTKWNDELVFWIGRHSSWCVGSDREWCDSKGFPDMYRNMDEYFEHDKSIVTIWQRNPLQQKVDEVRQHLGITNNNTLSVMIGREKSYLRKLLKRKASSATVEKVIAELDALIVVRPTIDSQSEEMIERGEIDAENWQTVGDASSNDVVGLNSVKKSLTIANLKLKNGLLQNEIRELNQKLELSNEIAEMWEENSKQSSKLNAWLFLVVILFIGLFIAWCSL